MFATLASERVTATGSPSGMKATIYRWVEVKGEVREKKNGKPITETISIRRVGVLMVPGKSRRSL